jgi:hypothetical protein
MLILFLTLTILSCVAFVAMIAIFIVDDIRLEKHIDGIVRHARSKGTVMRSIFQRSSLM